MKTKLLSGALAGLMLVTAAAPAEAGGRHGRHHHDDDVDVGDVVGAAVLIGGIAALAGMFSGDGDGRGGEYGAERKAIDACVAEAEGGASQHDLTRVRDITDVEKRDGYYFVSGYLNVAADGPDPIVDGFTCTTRKGRIYDFQRGSGYHW